MGGEEKTSRMFATNFKYFIDFYNSIKKYITIEVKTKKTGNKYKDMKIVMSGFRDKDLQEMIENNGGTIQSGVSKNTTILIIKDESVRDTSKAVKAKELGVNVMTKEEFIKFNP